MAPKFRRDRRLDLAANRASAADLAAIVRAVMENEAVRRLIAAAVTGIELLRNARLGRLPVGVGFGMLTRGTS
jgi:hypothetical protein